LEHHLRQYTRRNTSDFFIHRDLKGFLVRELDFYLKNEVLNLGDMDVADEDRAEGWFQMMRTIRSIGGQIIEFLDQIESFQKMLWEKRKFVIETQYCIALGHIDEGFHEEIARCDAQWDEWKALFNIDEEQVDLFNAGKDGLGKRAEFLRSHPTLVLDTKHFEQDFVDRLLGGYEDLEGFTDGVLIHSENWQALNLLLEKSRADVQCVYIDPPFNTYASEILYKNDYKHSSWLSLMKDRLLLAMLLVDSQGTFCVAIDDSEYHRLRHALSLLLGEDAVLGTAIIRSNPAGRSTLTGISIAHEYAVFAARHYLSSLGRLPKSEGQLARYKERDDTSQFEWVNFRKHGGYNANRFARPKLFYPIYATDSGRVRIPTLLWNSAEGKWDPSSEPVKAEDIVYPVNEKGEEKTWKWGHETAINRVSDLTARPDREGKLGIYVKSRLKQGTLPSTLWTDRKYSATDYGTNLLTHILGSSDAFSFPKSVYTVADCLRVCQLGDGDYCVDYFAGSGTTGHAVINLNREDGGQRKFILIEVGSHFDTVVVPRIKKVAFTPEWRDGSPARMATPEEAKRSPRIFKYLRLESYEDALNNIDFAGDSQQGEFQFDDYLLKYMLQWETKRSATLLHVENLSQPFRYTLNIHADGQTRQQAADIPETFNYLLGLRVETRRVYCDEDRRYLVYCGTMDQRRVAVIWRETEGWDKAALVRDKEFVAARKLTEGADEVYVNGDSLIRGAKALDPIFKRRMFAETQA
ncbi:MAG: DNA methyltransferase, partial [Chloroflexota bacterium]|nr:DNA methyltransferase [Chloroflexota bacterium]